jgi:Predicted metal-dependent hydrolase
VDVGVVIVDRGYNRVPEPDLPNLANFDYVDPSIERSTSVGVYRLWRDLGYAIGALLAGITADVLGLSAVLWFVAVLTLASGLIVAVPRDWYAGDTLASAYLVALSLTFPAGERFLIDSVRAYAADIDDPELAASVKAFFGQEAMHGKVHADMMHCMGLSSRGRGGPSSIARTALGRRVARGRAVGRAVGRARGPAAAVGGSCGLPRRRPSARTRDPIPRSCPGASR